MKKFIGEEVDRFCTASKHVVDDVVISFRLRLSVRLGPFHCIGNNCSVIGGKPKVLLGKTIYHRIELDNGGINPVSY